MMKEHEHHQGRAKKEPTIERLEKDVSDVLYTCPMHPDVQQSKPGICPRCGMALEPIQGSAKIAFQDELRLMTLRLCVCAVLSCCVVAIAMGGMIWPRLHAVVPSFYLRWGEALFTTPVVLWGGWPFFVRGIQSLMSKSLNMFTLITLGVASAYGLSMASLITPQIFAPFLWAQNGHGGLFFESAAVITTFVLLGQVLELKARISTRGAVQSLLSLLPSTALHVMENGQEEEVSINQLRVGDCVRLRPGESIPLDGVVLEGESSVDESMMTGESLPRDISTGSMLMAGAVNQGGSVLMRVEAISSDTILSKIIKVVETAERSKIPLQRMADVVSAIFVPIVIGLSVLTFFIWMWINPKADLYFAIYTAMSVLLVACPCALGLATPLSIVVGIGQGAHKGIVIRKPEVLEVFPSVTALIIDKTGTLTLGSPRLYHVESLTYARSELLSLIASLERASTHPLAKAVVAAAEEEGIQLKPLTSFGFKNGQGLEGVVEGKHLCIGNRLFLMEQGIDVFKFDEQSEALRERGDTLTYVGIDGQAEAMLAFHDPLKPGVVEAIQQLYARGFEVIMATGDHPTTAQFIAQRVGIQEYYAGVLPQQKVEVLEKIRQKHAKVAMAGDGVNDAPALVMSDVGIAMGTGSDVAIESSDIVLVRGDLSLISKSYDLAKNIVSNIKQNLFFAFIYNILGIPIAAGLFYPLFGVVLDPMVAAAAMSVSSICVIGNALRLKS